MLGVATKTSVLDAKDVRGCAPEDLVLLLGGETRFVERLHPVGELLAGHFAR